MLCFSSAWIIVSKIFVFFHWILTKALEFSLMISLLSLKCDLKWLQPMKRSSIQTPELHLTEDSSFILFKDILTKCWGWNLQPLHFKQKRSNTTLNWAAFSLQSGLKIQSVAVKKRNHPGLDKDKSVRIIFELYWPDSRHLFSTTTSIQNNKKIVDMASEAAEGCLVVNRSSPSHHFPITDEFESKWSSNGRQSLRLIAKTNMPTSLSK